MGTSIDLAILAALDEEIQSLRAKLSDTRNESAGAFHVTRGRLGGCEVILARTGIGKVNAALHTQTVISQYRPRAILFTGVAGTLVSALGIGDLVVATQAVQHDYDLTPFDRAPGFVPIGTDLESGAPAFFAEALRVLGKQSVDRLQGLSYFETSPYLRSLAFSAYDTISKTHDLPAAMAGTVASGDQFVADSVGRLRIQRTFGALCVEMEGAAAAQVCFLSGTPFLLLRFISDAADGSAPTSFDQFAREVANRSADLLEAISSQFFRQKRGILEREFKWIVRDPNVARITRTLHGALKRLGHSQRWQKAHLRDLYFDTTTQTLARSGATVRLREDDNALVCSLKAPGTEQDGLFRRQEIQLPVGHNLREPLFSSSLSEHLGQATQELEALTSFAGALGTSWSTLAASAMPTVLIENDRSSVDIRLPAGVVTLCVDDFTASTSQLDEGLASVEVEVEVENESLLSDDRLIAILAAIEGTLPCVGSTKSKYLRALEASS
jgi:adenosylhomocysteine nucleosidase